MSLSPSCRAGGRDGDDASKLAERNPGPRRPRATSGVRQAYAMSFSFLSGRTFTELLAGFAFTSIVSPGRNGFGTFFRALLRGLLHDLDLHQAGYRASADSPFLDMAL